MSDPLVTLVQQAADAVGGKVALAGRLNVDTAQVHRWLRGAAAPNGYRVLELQRLIRLSGNTEVAA